MAQEPCRGPARRQYQNECLSQGMERIKHAEDTWSQTPYRHASRRQSAKRAGASWYESVRRWPSRTSRPVLTILILINWIVLGIYLSRVPRKYSNALSGALMFFRRYPNAPRFCGPRGTAKRAANGPEVEISIDECVWLGGGRPER